MEIRRAWDRIHQTQPASERTEPGLVAFAEYALRHLSPGSLLLDAGCGRGRNALYLSQAGFHVHASDLSLAALEIAQARAQQAATAIHFQAADLSHLPYGDNVFQAAICVHVLPYQLKADMIKGICEMRRVLQPDGLLYFDLLDRDDTEYGCGQEVEEHTFLNSEDIPVHFSSQQEIGELSNGFTVECITRIEIESSGRPRVALGIWALKNDKE